MYRYKIIPIFCLLVFLGKSFPLFGQRVIPETGLKVYPTEINDVLNNPGIGFTTFQRFNGDELNDGIKWTEGFPIVYQDFDGGLTNEDYPQTTIAYYRVTWRFLELSPGKYNWALIDKALNTAAKRGQTLMLRISPYGGSGDKDVPLWYRKIIGKEKKKDLKSKSWMVDPENPAYVNYFGKMVAALVQRYDGHPDLEGVDVSFIGYYGEGAGMHLLRDSTRITLINAYLDNFKKTHLYFQPLNGDAPNPVKFVNGTKIASNWPDGRNNGEGDQMRNLGWRIDCLGDMTFWDDFSHMKDIYPQDIIKSGMSNAWKKAPITMEICGTFLMWLQERKYDDETVKYIFEQALKWHISSFNAKSSPVPDKWSPLVDKWLNKMGYRFVLRKFTFPETVKPQGQLSITSWWENKGVAPIYQEYLYAIRLINQKRTLILPTNADIRTWMPGDVLHDEKLYIPHDMPTGTYRIEVGLVSPVTLKPKVKLAINGVNKEGWYPMGEIKVGDK